MADGPLCTRESLARDFRALGLAEGMVVIVHSSLNSLGWVCGGAVSVVSALLDVLGPEGTLVVPTQTGNNSEPSAWRRPPVPEEWWPIIRAQMPAFEPRLTPSEQMGVIPEMVRTWPGAVRSNHPQVSFAAVGRDAATLMADHQLDDGLGEGSPLRRMYDARGWVLLLGVGHENNTSLHLAQYRVPGKYPPLTMGAALLDASGQRVWRTYRDIDLDTDDFPAIGLAFAEAQPARVRVGQVGAATAQLMPQRDLIDFATAWLRRGGADASHPEP